MLNQHMIPTTLLQRVMTALLFVLPGVKQYLFSKLKHKTHMFFQKTNAKPYQPYTHGRVPPCVDVNNTSQHVKHPRGVAHQVQMVSGPA